MVGHAKKYEAGLLKNYRSKDPIDKAGLLSQRAIVQKIANSPPQKPSLTNAMDLSSVNMV